MSFKFMVTVVTDTGSRDRASYRVPVRSEGTRWRIQEGDVVLLQTMPEVLDFIRYTTQGDPFAFITIVNLGDE